MNEPMKKLGSTQAILAMAVVIIALCWLSAGCTTGGIGYVVTNTHLETHPEGAGVCIGLPIIPAEVCLTVQPKNPEGDIGVKSFLGDLMSGKLGEEQRMASLRARMEEATANDAK